MMKNILLVTTTPTAINHYKSILDVEGDAHHWAVTAQTALALREVGQQPVQMILLNEKRNPKRKERAVVERLCAGSVVHWIMHNKTSYLDQWINDEKLFIISHQEHSGRGTIADFFTFWNARKDRADKENLFDKYFELSFWHALNHLKRKYLNEYKQQQLIDLGARFTSSKKINYTESLLLKNYPEVCEYLAKFRTSVNAEEELFHRIRLAKYFYSAY